MVCGPCQWKLSADARLCYYITLFVFPRRTALGPHACRLTGNASVTLRLRGPVSASSRSACGHGRTSPNRLCDSRLCFPYFWPWEARSGEQPCAAPLIGSYARRCSAGAADGEFVTQSEPGREEMTCSSPASTPTRACCCVACDCRPGKHEPAWATTRWPHLDPHHHHRLLHPPRPDHYYHVLHRVRSAHDGDNEPSARNHDAVAHGDHHASHTLPPNASLFGCHADRAAPFDPHPAFDRRARRPRRRCGHAGEPQAQLFRAGASAASAPEGGRRPGDPPPCLGRHAADAP
jgi:hypothetical protein